ncbi:glycosyltransferase family 2 protein [Bombella saccharophila]|uniref:Glycosyltransferase family 2 protein n=1 Tax=Bombella saccharophila TaxID=2967338 RepID=A0ABT3W5N2_9PROT|nr:glycosyltransferase family 2 protein [Bombella saccharophila]MCX5614376.1 glycosyltransferase family 2 protein [Bombella saccharophila]
MNADRGSFFYLETAHGGWLAVRQKDGAVCHVRSDEMTSRAEDGTSVYRPLLCVVFPQWPDYAFLTAEPPEEVEASPSVLWIDQFLYKGTVIPFRRIKTVESGEYAGLESVFVQERFCTTHAWSYAKGVNYLLGDCVQMKGWEQFHFCPVEPPEGALLHLGREFAGHFQRTISPEGLRALILNYEGHYLQHVLDGLFPFIRTRDLKAFAALLFKDKALLDALSRKVRDVFWLDAINSLVAWQDGGRPAAHGSLLCDAANIRLTYGVVGSPEGFLHMLLQYMRGHITPRKKVCLLSTVRNEGIYLLEWIAYHRNMGVEHFFIYSNDNDDQSDILLKTLHDEGIITYIDNKVSLGDSAQLKAYGHALNILPDILDYEWSFILDGDEFITLSPMFDKVQDYLRGMERWDTDAIALNWQFISSEVNQNGFADLTVPLTQRNRVIVSHGRVGEGWRLVKSVCRPQKVLQSRPHNPLWWYGDSFTYRLANGGLHEYRNPPPGIGRDPAFSDHGYFDKIYISHYYFKSIVEWIWKYARNSGLDGAISFGVERYADYWANSYITQLEDTSTAVNENVLLRELATQRELDRLRSIPAVREAENTVRRAWEERLNYLLDMIAEADVASRLREEWRYIFDTIPTERMGNLPLHVQ